MRTITRIGLLVERSRAFGRELCEGVINYAQDHEWELRYLDPNRLTASALSEFEGFIARVTTDQVARARAATGMPVVDVFYNLPNYGFSIVKERHEKIGTMAAEHFIDRRFRHFAYCPYGTGKTSVYCQNAYIHRIRREQLTCDVFERATETAYQSRDNEIICGSIEPPRDARALKAWLKRLPKPVAVFCPDDLRAWQVLETCIDAGLTVPSEVAVLGLDNDLLVCGGTRPMLSSIDPNTREIGRTAAETLEKLITSHATKPIIRQIPPLGVVTRTSTEIYPINPAWLSDALVFIHRNAKRGISAQDVIRHLGKSHTIVAKFFNNVLHTTVQHEIALCRLTEAKRLLADTTLDIAAIATMSGFSSTSYFTQAFSSEFHVAPSYWRQSLPR